MTPTPEQLDALYAAGQATVDLINERMEDAGIDDLGAVINLLGSVTAYFVGGIPNLQVQEQEIANLVTVVRWHLDGMPEDSRAIVRMEPVQ